MERQLENFILDPKLAELEQRLKRFNIFRALDVVRAENKHSNFFAFLLDPQETHRLGDRILKGFLANAVRNVSSGITPLKIHLSQIADTRVYREVSVKGSKIGRIDILIETVIDGNPWVIAIENKVDAKQGTDQLKIYRIYCENKYKNSKQLFIYLTPNGDEDPADDRWITSTYKEILDSLASIEDEIRNADEHSDFSFALLNYLDILRSDIMQDGDDEIARLCRDIYDQHRSAILEITKYSGNARSEAHKLLNEFICNKHDRYQPEGSYLGRIRFTDINLKNMLNSKFVFLKDKAETESGCPIYFAIINVPEMPLKICLIVRLTGYDSPQREQLKLLAGSIKATDGREWKRTELELTDANMADVDLIDKDELNNKVGGYLKKYEDEIYPTLAKKIEQIPVV